MINLIKLIAFVQEEIDRVDKEQVGDYDQMTSDEAGGFIEGKLDALKIMRCEIASLIAEGSK